MQHFYDGQIRRYITQLIRMLSNFYVKDIDGNLRQCPCLYGDMSKDVANLLNDNSENKFPSSPRIALYITSLELDRPRLSDSTFVSKVNIRERAYDANLKEYLNYQGKNYTVERIMPTPYKMNFNADIWTTNTDQKLQMLEQILVLFNPSLEIQTTDNFVDWTSLTVVNLEQVNWSSRTVGAGAGDEIDIATLGFSVPIWISAPAKVKKLGIVHSIITSIFDERQGTVELNLTTPELLAYADTSTVESTMQDKPKINADGSVGVQRGILDKIKNDTTTVIPTTYGNYNLLVLNKTVKILDKDVSWEAYMKAYPEVYRAGITQLRLTRADLSGEIIGTVSINALDPYNLTVNWDYDSMPGDTVLAGPTGNKNKIDYIIDPLKTNPTALKTPGLRLLLLDEPIGDSNNSSGAEAWKNADNTDFIAGANDIIEWSGSAWHVVFDASEQQDTIIYTTNLNTNIQYKFYNNEWLLSFEGEYPNGTWRLVF